MAQSSKRSLPPGVQQDPIFGKMWIKAGTLKLIRSSRAQYNLICQFWGQQSAAKIKTRSDMPNNEKQRTQFYQIRCPVIYFADYLKQMKHNLRLQVQGVGKVIIDVAKLLNKKKSITLESRQAFDHFNGFFQIIGTGNRKAGSIQIQMGCQFDPQIAYRQLGQQAIKEIRQSHIIQCPANNQKIGGCNGSCICHIKQKVNKKKELKQQQNTDMRIPHSLNTEQRPNEQFNADKYLAKQEKISQIMKNDQAKKQHCIIESAQKQEQKIGITQNQKFPQIPKILTYSRLRLDYEEKQETSNPLSQKDKEVQIQESERIHQITRTPQLLQSQKESPIQIPNQNIDKNQKNTKFLQKQFYQTQSQVEIKPKLNDTKSKNNQFQILQKVINIDQQMRKHSQNKNLQNPPLLEYDNKISKQFQQIPHGPTFRLIDNINNASYNNNNQQIYRKLGYEKQIQKINRLILNLLIQINTKTINFLSCKNKFTIAYRPYGTKQRTIAGPNFGEKITILNTVGENQIRKMDKLPMIVEFWDCVTGKFLGLMKIVLGKIKKGFLLNNRLNSLSIKTNLLPTAIYRGQISINDISDNKTGNCDIYACIGTSTQLNFYLNEISQAKNMGIQEQTKQINKEQRKQNTQKDQGNVAYNKKQMVRIYDEFLAAFDENSKQIIVKLLQLSGIRVINYKNFKKIFGQIENWEQLHSFLVQQIYEDDKSISFKDFSNSFDDYKQMQIILLKQYLKHSKKLQNSFYDDNHKQKFLKNCRQHSQFYIIKKNMLQEILQQFQVNSAVISSYLQLFSNQINIQFIQKSLNSTLNVSPKLINFPNNYINQTAAQQVFKRLTKKNLDADNLIQGLNNTTKISISKLTQYLNEKGVYISTWIIMHLFQNIKESFQIGQTQKYSQISLSCIYNWCVQKHRQSIKQMPIIQKQQIKRLKEESQELRSNPQKQDQIQQISNNDNNETNKINQDSLQKNKPQVNSQPIKQQNINKQNVASNSLNNSDQKQNQLQEANKIDQQKQSIFKYLFTIQPFEVQLQSPVSGNCQLSYVFPFQSQHIKSKNFHTLNDKFKYSIKMLGTHGFSIQDSPQNYLGDNVIAFLIKIDGRVQYQGALHVDEIIISPNTKQTKVIPLFSDRIEGMAGKLKINIEYERALNNQNTLGKQTTYQLFLPKNGYLNYHISTEINIHKIKTQLNLKDQFYIAMVFDVFHLAPNLKSLFPPISSKLFSDPKSIELSGSIKLHLSNLILEYIKEKNCKISLNIIYYTKDRGNFQRKQIVYAFIDIPLVNVIKSEGVLGNYAFKNKLGMFVSLAKSNIKYEKDSRNYIQANKTSSNQNKQNFWVLLHFLELINFQRTVDYINWIKFEFVLKGKKYTTQKAHIQHDAINPLRNNSIVVHLNEEDFNDVKIIPVTIYTNHNQRYAIDINLKALAKQLVHQKYTVNNQYFIVVNQNSQPIKMRVGLKLYGMRGSPVLSSFVDSLSHNLQTEVFNELSLPQQISQYDKMLGIFKRSLKLSTRYLDEVLNQLLISKHRDKLCFDFFTTRTYYKLDFTPIIVDIESNFQFIIEYLPGEVSIDQITNYLQQNNINLMNFRKQFLQRFCFKQLNKNKIDKNVQFLGLQDKVDLMSFIRKIKVNDHNDKSEPFEYQNQTIHNQTNNSQQLRQLIITILQGNNFHQLYNGIKPNAMIRIPDLGVQTQVLTRNSNPYFNQTFSELIQTDIINLKKLRVEVYHCSGQNQNILIGQGNFNFTLADLKHTVPNTVKIIRVVLNSVMSSNMKATLNLKLNFGEFSKNLPEISSQNYYQYQNSGLEQNSKLQSHDASRMGEIMQDIKKQMNYKRNLFQSSDDQY